MKNSNIKKIVLLIKYIIKSVIEMDAGDISLDKQKKIEKFVISRKILKFDDFISIFTGNVDEYFTHD